MQRDELRLELLKLVVPQATRVSLSEPEYIVKACTHLEQYVLDFNEGEKLPDSPPKRTPSRPKRTTENDAIGSTDPTPGG